MLNSNPNAAAAGVSGAVAIVVVALLGALGVVMSPVVSAAASAIVIAAFLFVGRSGLRAVKDRIWKGEEAA